MNTAIESAKECVNTLVNMPLLLVAALGLNVVSWVLKSIKIFPNDKIPATVVMVGGILGFFLVPMQGPADWAFNVANPEAADVIRRICIGITLGALAWLLERFAFNKLMNWIKQKFGNGDATNDKAAQ